MQIRLVLVLQLTSAAEILLEGNYENQITVVKPDEFNMLSTSYVYLNTAECTYAVFCKYCTS